VLRQRIITAVILASVFLASVIFLNMNWLSLLFAFISMAAAWEWAGLAGWTMSWQRGLYSLVLFACLVGLWFFCELGDAPTRAAVQPWLGIACLFWSVAMLLVESYPRSTWLWRSAITRTLMGWLILTATWLSAVFLLSLPHGPFLMVVLVVGVAAADISAYFVGRKWGAHKLAPAVSPGKTWEGLWGGVLGVLVVTGVVAAILPLSLSHLALPSIFILGLAFAGASVLGDLTVSMVKRVSGVKDSGSLLPGHGGVLDRLDSLCGASPVFALGLILMGY
jgi:phosphatidate cytidylyltransferase